MKHLAIAMALGLVLFGATSARAGTIVRLTIMGQYTLDVELFDSQCPGTAANFLSYVTSGAYDDTIIHRTYKPDGVTPWVIQGGGYTPAGFANTHIPTTGTITSEAGIANTRGTLAMARQAGDLDSASSEWFINARTNPEFDVPGNTYTVFGQVLNDSDATTLDGMDLVDAIAALYLYGDYYPATDPNNPWYSLPVIAQSSQLYFVEVTSVVTLPEPSALGLLLGEAGLLLLRRRHRR